MADVLADRAAQYMDALCNHYPDRHVGGEGNRAATTLFAEVCRDHGWEVEVAEFGCVAWDKGDAELHVAGESFDVHPGPYSLPFDDTATLAAASTIEELEAGEFEDAILLLHGEVARDQLMPKNFVFYNPDSHKRIVAALETKNPRAILAATGKHPMTPSVSPFPMIEDADVDIPSAYMRDSDGERLLAHLGRDVHLVIRSGRIGKRAEHVVARKAGTGTGEGRVVIFGHVDTREGTPGALDNATAPAAMMIAAELLAGHDGRLTIEMVPLNGEDYYGAPGQMLWVGENEGRMDSIVLGMNSDGAGYRGAGTEVSFYGVPGDLAEVVRDAMEAREGFGEGEPWYQSDHSIIAQAGRPVIAITTADFTEICELYAHTEGDTIELVDPAIVVEVGAFYADVVGRLEALAE
jgi:aminopeptidase YwaD